MFTQNYALTIDQLSKKYDNHDVLKNIHLTLNKGETLSIIGPSGAGKSTLARCVCGLESFIQGEIYIDQENIKTIGKNNRKRSHFVGMIFQQFNLWPHMTALENVTFGLRHTRNLSHTAAEKIAMEALEKVKLNHRSHYRPKNLSGGEQQRVAIARSLSLSPSLLVFDEPTSSLDPELVDEVLTVIKALSSENISMLIVTHEMLFAKQVSHHIAFMEKGQIVEHATTHKIFTNPDSERVRNFIKHIL